MPHNNGVIENGMNPKVKLTAYAVLVILAVWFGWGFYSNYATVTGAAAADESTPTGGADSNNPPSTTALTNAVEPGTNVAEQGTNLAEPGTNVADQATNTVDQATNSAFRNTNTAPGTVVLSNKPATLPQASVATEAKKPAVARDLGEVRRRMMGYLAMLVGALVGLGLLITYDFTHFVGNQATSYLYSDVAEAVRDPEYDRAEAVWANGHYLEAVQIMREFLKSHPREIHAALRIAEIYEKDLNNPLAAALEYEEVLKHKLSAERWGWAAIHLCNLYSRLGQQPKALALLRRVVEEYPRVAAAKKARAHLGLPELTEEVAGKPEEAPAEENAVIQIESPQGAAPPAPKPLDPPEPPPSNLPPGFWPKA